METSIQKEKLYELVPKSNSQYIEGNILKVGRYLIGRSESCDVVIRQNTLSAVHAVLEITPNGAKIFDMNSTNGTFVNGNKIVSEKLNEGDSVAFSNYEISFQAYQKTASLPPILDSLEPQKGEASTVIPRLPKTQVPDLDKDKVDDSPYIVYPLGLDPKAEFSEYIFEDKENLYPIFKYEIGKHAIEVIILFNDVVYSVDYLTNKDGTYHMVGAKPKKTDLEFAYLGETEKVAFVEISTGNCIVHKLHNYEVTHISDNNTENSNSELINLQGNDIVRLKNNHIEIFVRHVASPPKVATAPFFSRDRDLKKYVLIFLLLILIPVLSLNFFSVDEELEKEKDPERIATILYKQKLYISKNKAVEKTKKSPKRKQTTTVKKVVKKVTPTKKKVSPNKNAKTSNNKDPGKKTAKVVKPQKRKTTTRRNNQTKTPSPKVGSVANKSPVPKAKTNFSKRPSKMKGTVDVYRNSDFKSSISSLMAKGGSLKGSANLKVSDNALETGAKLGGGSQSNLQTARVENNVGNISGATVGSLDASKGVESGMSAKSGLLSAGIPAETVVLGSMDPDVIRRILRAHIPQFRYCYQQELDKKSAGLQGRLIFLFSIGASGHVTKAGVDGGSRLPPKVKRCVAGVLRGIQFPPPPGGGKVDVRQPFNFSPKRL